MMEVDNNLFEKIRDHLQSQARNGERIDTETELAKRFGVTRYRIRKELDVLTQMGILVRTPKRGTSVREVGASSLRDQIQMRFDVANFDVGEFIEARALIECSLMPLVSRRMTPALASRLEGTLQKMEE
ncbi:MAG: FadR family transcriptional regulator, partial [Burkholderiaceae bacterium]|nr:FadR family transcriptional regulator [Burkholderiaceae bacterium]